MSEKSPARFFVIDCYRIFRNIASYNGNDFINLSLDDQNIPYIFTLQYEVDTAYTSVPKFYNTHYTQYKLSLATSPNIVGSGESYYFKTAGTYKLTINLITFEITAELLPE